jgi:TRAP-type mannitol/chloroaromatic compound transport system, small permease component
MGIVQHRLPAVLAWTLLDNEHIRIDIVNNMLPKQVRNSIEIIGQVFFLMPLCIVMIITGVPFFRRSVEINEQSGNAGGLPNGRPNR